MLLTQFIFWLSALGLFYIYLGYPLLIWGLAKMRPRPPHKAPFEGRVSVVVVAYNERDNLPAKLRSLLQANRADELIDELVVASDGSTDDTAIRVADVHDPRVRLIEFREQRGKPSVLNDVIPPCRNAIVVLTDARQELHPGALDALLSGFADPAVGVISGELVFRQGEEDSPVAKGMDFYWRYEKTVRRSESLFASVPGATGAFYGLRRDLFRPIPADCLLDDVAIPMSVVEGGARCVFNDGAIIYDTPSRTAEQEAARKRRTIAGNAQLVRLYPRWLVPWRNPIWFQFVSHKLLRLASPFLLLGAIGSNVLLAGRPAFLALLALEGLFCMLAALGALLRRRAGVPRPIAVPFAFMSLNFTTLLALWEAGCNRYQVQWRQPRGSGTGEGGGRGMP
jgi:poly-beta-1,6-N-acetyl-D-glucosamine synthase